MDDDERLTKTINEIVEHFYSNGKIRDIVCDMGNNSTMEFKVLCCKTCLNKDIDNMEHDNRFWFDCGNCNKAFCFEYDCFIDEDYSSNTCLKCILEYNHDVYKEHPNCGTFVKIFLEYTNLKNRQIESLLEENAKLQAMVDYQPDGKGFVEAKEHFEMLAGKNEI